MSHEDALPEGLYTGVEVGPDGQLDLSRAAIISFPEAQAAKQDPLQDVLEQAAAVGLSEPIIKEVIQGLRNRDKPFDRQMILNIYRKKTGLPGEQIMGLARKYEKERIQASERGALNHYHQTSFAAFESLGQTGGLMSYDTLKQLGKTTTAGTGTRPDVVQMTRDRRDQNGHLTKPGISDNTMGANNVDVALVFDDSVMDVPDYDCIDNFPNAPIVPVKNLTAVLANDEAGTKRAREIVEQNGWQAEVTTRAEWISRLASAESPDHT